MKLRSVLGLLLFVAVFAAADVAAQNNKTIVLARHAEKVAIPPTDPDPDLSPEGRERAIRLMHAIKKHKPHEIFSTNYKRTRLTAEPIANRRRKQIQTYDPSKPADLVAKIMASKTEHFLVVGHSNTIPGLANLLMKKEVFRNLLDPEYGVFWVIRMKKGAVTRIEVFPY